MSYSMTTSPLPDPDYDAAFYDGVLPKRFFAWVIDVALILASMALLSVLSLGIALVLWIPIHALLAFFYRWLTITKWSATLGMRVMNIELRGPSGAPLSQGEAALHTLVFLAGAIFAMVQLVSIGLMLGSTLNRGLADHSIGSVMLNRAAP